MTDAKSVENIESLLKLSETLEAVGGVLLNGDFPSENFCFTSVQTDSRLVVEKSLFVPLIGENQDGHLYVPQALEKGASAVFVSKKTSKNLLEDLKKQAENNKNVAFILVENTMRALQKAAECYVRKFPRLIRCAVTGSSGKTTTKEIASSILRQKFSVIATKGNFNSETGLPLSVFNIRSEHELGLFEMGMNRVNEIGEIAEVFKPNYAIITNIGTAHIGILGSRQNIANEKKKIFNYIDSFGSAFIPKTDDFASFLEKGVKGKVVKYGIDCDESVKLVVDEGLAGTVFSVDGLLMRLSLPGKYNFLNALGAIALAKELGCTAEQIKAGIESLKPLGGRSTIRKGRFTVLEDCYNANPDSMEKALDLCADTKIEGKKIYVLGDMLELGEKSEEEHSRIGEKAVFADADMIIFFGFEMNSAFESAIKIAEKKSSLVDEKISSVRILYIGNKDEAAISDTAREILDFAENGDLILLKGSRGMGLERILPLIGMDGSL
ncbi:UDP-N-acetylmuramoyl-tripeptide--D-alanyl-D-alanine ligase [uncultured Treponema sp.]|uniref:UDP-N-acetylmuramoyl-tripeptide--D-alanyl-D- alanine ligase n=1 Tax=uncultured Treponema sp. TaxID=162155 RepID=UPI0025FA4544|nr:UDP-N-acetylmuramoyl-tripeptide--D-alanyl-D-alanine ligase [uncultured Treponema sp.]